MNAAVALVWFRQDLRLSDNPALAAAVERGYAVIPVYIWAPAEEGSWRPGAASQWWLGRSLAALKFELEKLGSRLIIRRGPTIAALKDLLQESGATAVFWNRRYEPAAVARDREVKSTLRERGITAESFNGSLLFEPWTIQNGSGGHFRVFSAFWRACLAKFAVPALKDAPKMLHSFGHWPRSLAPSRSFPMERMWNMSWYAEKMKSRFVYLSGESERLSRPAPAPVPRPWLRLPADVWLHRSR